MAVELSEELLLLSDKLVAASIRRELPGRAIERQLSGLTSSDYIRLVNEAARLALSDEPEARTVAYEIATHALALSKGDKTLVRAVEFILARLGNFPGRELLRARYHMALAEAAATPTALTFEAFGHEYDNTIESSAGQTLKLTDFQIDLFDAMENTSAVSVSAPTSAGKSFILSLQILRRLRTTEQAAVVYVVPTRALIREVILRLRQALQRADMLGVALRSVPQPVSREDAPYGVVYVLTQERLLSLLLAAGEDFWLTMMVIDEAQGVRDGGRGVLLQTAVHAVLRRFPNAECVFASPLINNPQYLLDLFGREGSARLETHSPVAQSFIVVSPDSQDSGHARFSLLRRGRIVQLAVRDLGFDFTAIHYLKRRAQLAFSVTAERDACLVYANGAWEAEATAEALATLRADRDPPREVQEFITYIEQNIHPKYGLLSALKRGVGFHHGKCQRASALEWKICSGIGSFNLCAAPAPFFRALIYQRDTWSSNDRAAAINNQWRRQICLIWPAALDVCDGNFMATYGASVPNSGRKSRAITQSYLTSFRHSRERCLMAASPFNVF